MELHIKAINNFCNSCKSYFVTTPNRHILLKIKAKLLTEQPIAFKASGMHKTGTG
jgi:hypothetical protein